MSNFENELPHSLLRGILASLVNTFLTPSSVQQSGRFSAIENKLREIFKLRFKKRELLADYTTFKIGGPADYFVEVKTADEMVKTVRIAKEYSVPIFILGGGSNILVSDEGFRGLVIKNKIEGIKILGYKGDKENGRSGVKKVRIEVESGTTMNRLVRFTIQEGIEGLEDFLGLPGTVGGAIAGNSHWGKKRIKDYVIDVRLSDDIILSVIFSLKKARDKKDLWQRGEEAIKYRKKTQPLDFPSAGCIFKNITKKDAQRLKTPNLTQSTGFLIEKCGLKGKRIGNAQVSEIHGNFIVNLGGARATDVVELIKLIKKEVFKKFRVSLKEEIIYVGFNKRT